MRKRFFELALIALMVLLLISPNATAQNQRVGTSAGSELLIPIGARDIAMSGSTIATSTGIEAIYWNPAGLGRFDRGTEAMVSHMSYIADIGMNYAAIATNIEGFGVLGFSLKSLNFGNISLTTNEDPYGESGATYSPTYINLGLTYARHVTDAISVGFSFKLISNTIDRVAASGVAFDFGVQYSKLIGIDGLNIGVTVKNIGPQMKFDGSGLYIQATPTIGDRPTQRYKIETASFDLPSLMEIGLGYMGKAGTDVSYAVNASFTNDNLYDEQYRVGGELGFGASSELTILGRAGYEFVPQISSDAKVWGPTYGAGLRYSTESLQVDIDYAYRTAQYFDGNHILAVKFGF